MWYWYISGPISARTKARQERNIMRFLEAAYLLREKTDHSVFCPPEHEEPGGAWEDYLRDDIGYLVDCQCLVLLPGWWHSKGARLERHIAKKLKMPIYKLRELL